MARRLIPCAKQGARGMGYRTIGQESLPPAGTSRSGATLDRLSSLIDGFLYITGGSANRVPLITIDPDVMRGVGVFSSGDNGTRLANPMAITSTSVPRLGDKPRTFVIVQGSYSETLTIDADRNGPVGDERDPERSAQHGLSVIGSGAGAAAA